MDKEIWVTIISGIFGSVVAPLMPHLAKRILGKKDDTDSSDDSDSKRLHISLQAGGGGIIGVLVGYFLISPIVLSPCPPFAPTRVDITSPVSGMSVPRLVTVQGTACHIPVDADPWVLVVPEGVTAFYPQAGPVVVTSDGQWSASAYIGLDDPIDVGRGFVIIAALTDHAGSTAIREYFAQDSTEGYVGLEPLPGGIRLVTQVQVVRK